MNLIQVNINFNMQKLNQITDHSQKIIKIENGVFKLSISLSDFLYEKMMKNNLNYLHYKFCLILK